MTTYREFNLDISARDYMREQLALAGPLGFDLLDAHDLEAGRIVTWLPDDIAVDGLELFDDGILPVRSENVYWSTDVAGVRRRMERLENTDPAFVEIISAYLSRDASRLVLFEDAAARASHGPITPATTRIVTCEDMVYHVVLHDDRAEEFIANTIAGARAYPTVGVLTSPADASHRLTESDQLSAATRKQLAERADAIVVGAYDREGFLIWWSPTRG